jgi:hypothetical protein
MTREYRLSLVGPGGSQSAVAVCSPNGRDCRLELRLDDGRTLTADERDYFECLLAVRSRLQTEGIRVCCQGARRDVWPSSMARDMGSGLAAYVLTSAPGRPELVPVFDPADVALIGTVEEQEAHFRSWWEHRTGKRLDT